MTQLKQLEPATGRYVETLAASRSHQLTFCSIEHPADLHGLPLPASICSSCRGVRRRCRCSRRCSAVCIICSRSRHAEGCTRHNVVNAICSALIGPGVDSCRCLNTLEAACCWVCGGRNQESESQCQAINSDSTHQPSLTNAVHTGMAHCIQKAHLGPPCFGTQQAALRPARAAG